jgi:hypothetical protein
MVWYETKWYKQMKNGGIRPSKYRTKSLTPAHKRCRDASVSGSFTIKADDSIEWPFGVYSEVIAESEKKPPMMKLRKDLNLVWDEEKKYYSKAVQK